MRQLIEEGLAVRPEQGGGNTLVGLFASGRIGTTPAGGYWVQGLAEGGMAPDQYDVQYFPKCAPNAISSVEAATRSCAPTTKPIRPGKGSSCLASSRRWNFGEGR